MFNFVEAMKPLYIECVAGALFSAKSYQKLKISAASKTTDMSDISAFGPDCSYCNDPQVSFQFENMMYFQHMQTLQDS